MKKGASLRVLMWIGATLLLSGEASSQSRTSNACYSSGGDCGFHSLACERGLFISVQDMYYGFKDEATYTHYTCDALLTDCSAYVTREPCCRYNVTTDCMTSFSNEHGERVKQDCDGKVSCRVRATDVSGSCSKPPKVYGDVSSYSVITYVCVDASRMTATTSPPVVDCGPGCRSSTLMTSTSVVEVTSSGKEDEKENDNDKRMLQLIIGVSIGVGAGFLFLFTALIVCWIRMQRKPPDSLSVRSGPSMAHAVSLPRRPSKALTLTSTMPSSHYSSFLYSDTLPSSHPNSVYLESIYSVAGNGSPPSSIGPASLLRANGYCNDEAVVPAVHSSDDLSRPPDAAERSSLPPPTSDSGSSAALPPQLPARPSILKPIITNSQGDKVGNGACVVSTIQLSEKRSDSGTSSSEHTARTSPEGVQVTRCSQCSKSSVRRNPSLSTDDSNPTENGATVTRYKQSSKTSRSKSRSVSTGDSTSGEDGAPHHHMSSSHKPWWNPLRFARDSVQSDHASEASSVPVVVPEEAFEGGIPVSQHSQDKHDAVESWLGVVKPQVPF